MKTYTVTCVETVTYEDIKIEAESEKEAEEKAMTGDYELTEAMRDGLVVVSVTEVE